MLTDVLPEDVAQEIRDRPAINTTQKVVEYVSSQLARYNDKQLGKIYDDAASKALETVPKNPILTLLSL